MAHFPVRTSLQVLRVLFMVPRHGMCVLVSKVNPLMEKETREGFVIGHSASELHVMFERRWKIDNEKWRYGKKLSSWERANVAHDRLDIGTSDSSYTRMVEALHSLHDDPETQEAASTAHQEIALNGTYLRDIILSNFAPFSPDDLLDAIDVNAKTSDESAVPTSSLGFFAGHDEIMDWARRYNRDDPLIQAGDPEILLNKSQIRAIAQMLSERISLVQGVSTLHFRVSILLMPIGPSLQGPERRGRLSKRSGYSRSTSRRITLSWSAHIQISL